MSSLTAMPAYHKIPGETEAAAAPRRKRGGRRLPGGLLIIGAASLILALATAQECHSVTHFPSLLYGLVLWGWWGVVAGTLWQLGPKMPSLLRLSPLRIALHLMAGCIVAAAHLVMLGSLSLFIPEWRVNAPVLAVLTGLLHVNRFGMEILIYGFIFGLTGIVQFQVKAQRDAMRSLELQRQLAAAHLKALQMQMEPHFLFNTLNAITTLVEMGRQAQAAQMLGHLNAILKRTLERNAPEKVPLSQELEVVENYLAIEQVRFADRLRVDIKVDPGALQSLVPCFLLQPIVENAIRHGIAHCEDEGFVEASAKREGNRLRISVRDTGAGIKGRATPGSGIGLTNTRERLAYFYPDAYEMEAGPIKAGGFEVAIELPYERAG
jgi:signal transduction histidine kinase